MFILGKSLHTFCCCDLQFEQMKNNMMLILSLVIAFTTKRVKFQIKRLHISHLKETLTESKIYDIH